jgi:hypothetical protein
LAKAWIDDCFQSHHLCPKLQNATLPTKLLDVGGLGDALDTLRLVVAKEGEEGKWIALSYCWGNTNHCRTTTKNLEEHLQHISFGQLPLTVQDAIRVTRSLSVRYLWG